MRDLTDQNLPARWGRRACLGLAVGVLSACSGILDVDLPAELTDAALVDPAGAEIESH